MTFPSLLFFAKQEFYRFEAGGAPFSLVIFNAYLAQGQQLMNMPEPASREMLQRIQSIKRPFEMVGHFETLDYALLLPQTELKTAALVAQRIVFALKSKHLFDRQDDFGNIQISLGVAGVPEDGDSLEALLGAAAAAKRHSIEKRIPIVVFGTMLA